MKRIALMVFHLSERDGVGYDVLGMYSALSGAGYRVRVFAGSWSDVDIPVGHISTLPQFLKSAYDLVIYHYPTGWDEGLSIFLSTPARKMLRFHNVTPPEFFRAYSNGYAQICEHAQSQILQLLRHPIDCVTAPSHYNLNSIPIPDNTRRAVRVSFHPVDNLRQCKPDPYFLREYSDGAINLLCVGRLVPNKGHSFLLDSLRILCDRGLNARLILAGSLDSRLIAYTHALRQRIRDLNLVRNVVFTDSIAPEALSALYRSAAVFVLASEHEGLCVPLIESMALEVPIVALARAAVADTIGPAGIVWNESSPQLFALAVERILQDDALCAHLKRIGLQRYHQNFQQDHIRGECLRIIESIMTPEKS
ncbi:MAG: glycosyltransferase [Leptospiraceae bacterium]|nr:glycosyltransferase [Leptospiraceae bacterium]MCB1315857.1 glycosyltransferase [Leptospiraceae bacterium]